MFGNRRLKALKWVPASARWLAWTFATHPPQKVRPSVKGPLIVEPTEGLEISKQAPASTFVLHLARDWPQFHTRRASQSLQRKGTRVAPGQTQGQGRKGHPTVIPATTASHLANLCGDVGVVVAANAGVKGGNDDVDSGDDGGIGDDDDVDDVDVDDDDGDDDDGGDDDDAHENDDGSQQRPQVIWRISARRAGHRRHKEVPA